MKSVFLSWLTHLFFLNLYLRRNSILDEKNHLNFDDILAIIGGPSPEKEDIMVC